MNPLALRLLLLGSLLVSATAVGCSDDVEDPFAGSDTGSTGRDAATDPGRTDTGGVEVGVDTSVDVPTGSDVPDTGNDSAGGDTGGGDGGGSFVCGEDVVFTGQVFVPDEVDPLSPDGGAPRFEPYDASYDAGIAEVVAAAPASGDPVTVTLEVTEATVVASSFNNETARRAQRVFWLADGGATIQVFLADDDTASQPSFSIKVGQRISGTVTKVGSYQGMAQITAASSWTLVSEGNEVAIAEAGASRPLTAADAHRVVRATGTLTALESDDCGGARCFSFNYGAASTVTLRTSSDFVEVGTCITFVGPVRLFSGAPQLDTLNFDWLWTYQAE